MGRPPFFALAGCAPPCRRYLPPVKLCLEELPHCFPGSEKSSWQNSLTISLSSPYSPPQYFIKCLGETQLTSKSTTSLPFFQSNDTVEDK